MARDFHGERRTNDTHHSATDPEAKLFRKGQGKEAKLCFMGHALMENRHVAAARDLVHKHPFRPELAGALRLLGQQ